MSDPKKSFFEKLTGSLRIDDDKTKKEKVVKKIDYSQLDSEPHHRIEVKESDDGSQKTKREMKSQETEEKNWPLDEQEGQLTIDVYQTPTEIVIKSTIAGVNPEDLDITFTNDMVTVRGRRKHEEEIKRDDYFYQECYWGAFSRSIILPVDVEADKATAALKNGILTIRLPKAEKVRTRKIKVRGEE